MVFLVNNHWQKSLCIYGLLIQNYISILYILLKQNLQSNISWTLKKVNPSKCTKDIIFSCSRQQHHIFWENTEKRKLNGTKYDPFVDLNIFSYFLCDIPLIRVHNNFPVDTRRRFSVYKTSMMSPTLHRCLIDAETTSCVYWVSS